MRRRRPPCESAVEHVPLVTEDPPDCRHFARKESPRPVALDVLHGYLQAALLLHPPLSCPHSLYDVRRPIPVDGLVVPRWWWRLRYWRGRRGRRTFGLRDGPARSDSRGITPPTARSARRAKRSAHVVRLGGQLRLPAHQPSSSATGWNSGRPCDSGESPEARRSGYRERGRRHVPPLAGGLRGADTGTSVAVPCDRLDERRIRTEQLIWRRSGDQRGRAVAVRSCVLRCPYRVMPRGL